MTIYISTNDKYNMMDKIEFFGTKDTVFTDLSSSFTEQASAAGLMVAQKIGGIPAGFKLTDAGIVWVYEQGLVSENAKAYDERKAAASAQPKEEKREVGTMMIDLIDRELGNESVKAAEPTPRNPEPSPIETFVALNDAAKATGFKNPYRLDLPYRDDGEPFDLDHPIVVRLIADMEAHLRSEAARWNGTYCQIFERGIVNRFVLVRYDNVHDLNTHLRTPCGSARIETERGLVHVDSTDRYLIADMHMSNGDIYSIYVREL